MGGPGGLGEYPRERWISIMRLMDGQADRAEAWRRSILHARTGQPLRDEECEIMVSGRFEGKDRGFIQALFRKSPGAV